MDPRQRHSGMTTNMANKIIIVTGPREGVGKSTLAANLASRYAQMRKLPVVLIDTDPALRQELAQMAGGNPALTVVHVIEQLASKQTTIPMLRGRIPVNRQGIGVMSLGAGARDLASLTPERWGYFLQSFSQIYDLVVDLESTSPLQLASIDIADHVVWTMLPNALSLKATLHSLETLENHKFSFQKFSLVANQADLPNSLPAQTLNNALEHFGKAISVSLPFEPEIPRLLNLGRPILFDSAKSAYIRAVATLADTVSRQTGTTRGGVFGGPDLGAFSSTSTSNPAAPLVPGTKIVDSVLDEKRKRWDGMKQGLHRDLVEELNIRHIDLDTKGDPVRERQLRTNVESTVNSLIGRDRDLVLTREEREKLVKELVDEALGLGPLEELLRDPSITEIMVNRSDQVFIERRGKITLSDKRFIDNNHVVQVIRRIIAPLGRRIDETVPLVDARLKDGSRVNAIIPPLAVSGPSITIRRFPEKAFASSDLIQMGAVTREMIDFLKICVLLKKNMVIAGGTGTGKTTILNMLSSFIPEDERIVTVEDTAELRLQQEHIVRLEARPANIEGSGAISIRDLVKNCLRMRPDRIVVGECRGGEALDMLQAMNTGHDGSLTTIHANSPRDAFTRLETLCLMAGMDLPVWALREQIRSAVHVLVQLSRLSDGSRKITCITEVTGRNEDTILTQDLFRFVQDNIDEKGHVQGHYEATGNVPKFFPELKAKGLTLDLKAFEKHQAA